MIKNCKCGQYQFDVKKSDLEKSNKEVQCGICNEKWIHGESVQKRPSSYKISLVSKLIIFLIFFIALVGIIDLSKSYLVSIWPILHDYYIINISKLIIFSILFILLIVVYDLLNISKLIIFSVVLITLIGVIDLSKKLLVNMFPGFQDYYIAKEQVILKIITLLQ